MTLPKSLFFVLAAIQVTAIPVAQGPQDSPLDKSVKLTGLSRAQQGHIIVPGGIAPEVQELKPLYPNYAPGIKRTKIRYGKWTIPSVSDKTAMSLLSGEAGTMQNVKLNMKKPCEDCGLTLMQAGLEYADGTVANTDSGAWLHHIVLLMNGPNRKDVMCPFTPGQRFFSSGNERMMITYTDLENKKINSVYPMRKADNVFMQLELMNLKEEKKDVYITIDYEYMDKIPQGFKETKAVWLDVTGCGISSTSAPKGKSSFSMTSTKWTAPYDGQLLSTGGHLHDGGVNVLSYQDKKPICNAKATYSKAPPMNPNPAKPSKVTRDGGHGNEDMPHIEDMSTCDLLSPFSKGQQFWIDANYDYGMHPGMKSVSGGQAEIMGIALMYVAV
ncbi:hypothetical protein Vi05172_g12242 [Venturia inaequalis]|nr:hypothetical protein Vi05172_g12242 [Venturia inaequalis]